MFISVASAQKAEVTISLNESFFDALLDGVFQNFAPPEFLVASTVTNSGCSDSVKILREMTGVRTAVRFRDGKVNVPLAFTGNYAAPLIGCMEFSGWAESNIDLEFDQQAQKLLGRVRVVDVNLNGTGGVGGTMIARLIQTSIDKRLNPIEIVSLDKVSFGFPMQRSGSLRMKALRIRPEVSNGLLNIRVDYEFLKG